MSIFAECVTESEGFLRTDSYLFVSMLSPATSSLKICGQQNFRSQDGPAQRKEGSPWGQDGNLVIGRAVLEPVACETWLCQHTLHTRQKGGSAATKIIQSESTTTASK